MEKLIEGLQYFHANVLWQKRELFEECAWGQRPFAMLITCSDSRLLPETLLQLAPGDLFVSRNAGNIVPPPDWPGGEAAGIEYAVSVLGVTDLIVCGHYRCGAVDALFRESDPSRPAIDDWLRHAAETREIIERDHPALTGEARWDKAVEQNVLVQSRHLAQHPAVASRLSAGTVRIHCWTVRLETGQILTQSREHERFVPLLELPVIRATAVSPRWSAAPISLRPSRRMLRWGTGTLVASALGLLTLAGGEDTTRRLRGLPPSCVCLNDGRGANGILPGCSAACPAPKAGESVTGELERAERNHAWE